MNALLIAAIIFIVVGTMHKMTKVEQARKYRAANTGSRTVEKEEWNRCSRKLFAEYKALTKLDMYYPTIVFKSKRFERDYYDAFSILRDTKALEVLRVRHNLPSDDEIYTMQEYMYSVEITNRPPNYTSLAYIINQCVFRAINERKLKYGGTDYGAKQHANQKWKAVDSKYPWMKNDPTV